MEFSVVRCQPLQSGSEFFKGYASVEFTDGERTLIVNGFSIMKTKAGKLMARPPQTKGKDDKYYDQVTLKDQLLWDVSNAVIEEYERQTGISSPKSESNGSSSGTKSAFYDPWADANG